MEWKNNIHLFLIPLMVCIGSVTLFLLYTQLYWMSNPTRGNGGYCEVSNNGLFIEPINTWSNLGFIIVGLIIAWQMMWGSFKTNTNILIQSDFMSIFFSSLVICLGPAAMFMHATYTSLGIELDVLSEYLICAFLVAYGTQRFFFMSVRYFLGTFVLVIILCELISQRRLEFPIIGGLTNLLVAMFLILSVVIELLIVFVRKSNIKKRWGIASVITLLTAFLIWNFSSNGGLLCYPSSWFQGHALWHVLDALALYFLFRYYASENNSVQSNLTEEFF